MFRSSIAIKEVNIFKKVFGLPGNCLFVQGKTGDETWITGDCDDNCATFYDPPRSDPMVRQTFDILDFSVGVINVVYTANFQCGIDDGLDFGEGNLFYECRGDTLIFGTAASQIAFVKVK